jgi:Helix-turn-helix domain
MRGGMTLKQVAERFGVAASTARLWQSQGYFPNAKLEETVIGPVWLVPKSDVDAFKPPPMGRPAGKKGKSRGKRKTPKKAKV